jgi:hypothetical protein
MRAVDNVLFVVKKQVVDVGPAIACHAAIWATVCHILAPFPRPPPRGDETTKVHGSPRQAKPLACNDLEPATAEQCPHGINLLFIYSRAKTGEWIDGKRRKSLPNGTINGVLDALYQVTNLLVCQVHVVRLRAPSALRRVHLVDFRESEHDYLSVIACLHGYATAA